MLFRASLVVAVLFAQGALSATCPAGTYRPTSNGNCVTCPDGYYRNVSTPNGQTSVCTACDSGKESASDHKSCTPCPNNTASTGGTMCELCPAGQEAASNHKKCNKCNEGEYNDVEGGTCKSCPAGSFNNIEGAKSCCQCCAGFYQFFSGQTSCSKCPDGFPNGPIGSTSILNCKSSPNGLPSKAASCDMVAQNKCPNPTGPGSVGSPIARKKRDVACTKGFEACPHYSGRGGFDCVDTTSDAESCGGCVGIDGSGPGTDCTAIKGVSVTRCVNRSCVIDSCRKGWVKSIDGTSCVLASRTTGSGSETAGLYAQDVDAKKKRTSAKRAIRANIY